MNRRKTLSIMLSLALLTALLASLSGCGRGQDGYAPVSGLDTKRAVALKIAIPNETNKALNAVANAFMQKYPNVSMQLTYIEDYNANAIQLFKDNALDIILQRDVVYEQYTVKNPDTGEKTPTGATPEDYFYNFAADQEIDFSDTTPDLSDNYRHFRDADGERIAYQYCYPLGGEMRGIFVNTTMLDRLGLTVPKNYPELVACCEAIQRAGYIPIQGHISTLAYGLGIAEAANTVTHNPEGLKAMAEAREGVSAYFADTIRKIYQLCLKRYCDYKAVEATGYFTQNEEKAQAESFLGLSYDESTYEVLKPENNVGSAAFFPYISSLETTIRDLIEEYGLDTKVAFICSPLNDEGRNSPAYITPYYGVCANKNSDHLIWIREFVNFLFQRENMLTYAENASIIPNTKDALQYVAKKHGIDVAADITLCGQINFSDSYNGFRPIADSILTVNKCNAPKYMVKLNKADDGSIQFEKDENGREFLYLGNGETVVYKEYVDAEDPAMPGYAFCTLEYYLNNMESEFAKYRGL